MYDTVETSGKGLQEAEALYPQTRDTESGSHGRGREGSGREGASRALTQYCLLISPSLALSLALSRSLSLSLPLSPALAWSLSTLMMHCGMRTYGSLPACAADVPKSPTWFPTCARVQLKSKFGALPNQKLLMERRMKGESGKERKYAHRLLDDDRANASCVPLAHTG